MDEIACWRNDQRRGFIPPTGSIRRALLFFLFFSEFQTTGFSLQWDHPSIMQPVTTIAPYLEPIKYNTTVFVGQTAYLPCIIKHLGDKTVSWIRKKDLHILTSGNQIYTNDKRFYLLREGKLLNSWTLKISSVQLKDDGTYECQINTEPKMTLALHLIVLGSDHKGTHHDENSSGAVALGMLDSPMHQNDDHEHCSHFTDSSTSDPYGRGGWKEKNSPMPISSVSSPGESFHVSNARRYFLQVYWLLIAFGTLQRTVWI